MRANEDQVGWGRPTPRPKKPDRIKLRAAQMHSANTRKKPVTLAAVSLLGIVAPAVRGPQLSLSLRSAPPAKRAKAPTFEASTRTRARSGIDQPILEDLGMPEDGDDIAVNGDNWK